MESARTLTTIDTHTAGGPTRILTSGLPFLQGANVAEKYAHFKDRFDPIRKLLLNEPRGHKDMYGAVITETQRRDADLGIFFMTTAGYLPTCVHSAIGAATALLHTGTLSTKPPKCELVFETPAGLIALEPHYQAERLASISLQTLPAYVQQFAAEVRVAGRDLRVDLIFSGVFFVLVEAKVNSLELKRERLPEFVSLGPQVLAEASRNFETRHADEPPAGGFALVLFYERTDKNRFKDIVIGRTGNVDRSPCGAGSGALAVLQFSNGSLGPGEEIIIEGIIGTHFGARIIREAAMGSYSGGIPQINGSAYITGFHQFVLEAEDPLNEGFLLG